MRCPHCNKEVEIELTSIDTKIVKKNEEPSYSKSMEEEE